MRWNTAVTMVACCTNVRKTKKPLCATPALSQTLVLAYGAFQGIVPEDKLYAFPECKISFPLLAGS